MLLGLTFGTIPSLLKIPLKDVSTASYDINVFVAFALFHSAVNAALISLFNRNIAVCISANLPELPLAAQSAYCVENSSENAWIFITAFFKSIKLIFSRMQLLLEKCDLSKLLLLRILARLDNPLQKFIQAIAWSAV